MYCFFFLSSGDLRKRLFCSSLQKPHNCFMAGSCSLGHPHCILGHLQDSCWDWEIGSLLKQPVVHLGDSPWSGPTNQSSTPSLSITCVFNLHLPYWTLPLFVLALPPAVHNLCLYYHIVKKYECEECKAATIQKVFPLKKHYTMKKKIRHKYKPHGGRRRSRPSVSVS